MVFWRDYKIHKYNTYQYNQKEYTDVILSFDCETTSFFKVKNKWVVQDLTINKKTGLSKINPDIYSAAPKCALSYIWQMGINDDVVYGREMPDFIEFLKRFCKINKAINIIYVHNLGFDFTFFCEYLPNDLKVFSKAAYKPMYVKSKIMHTEFRCSYMLTNMSLETCAKQFGLKVKKLKGVLAYNVARSPKTALTEEEMLYCEYDVRVINEMIMSIYIPRYGRIANIPLTLTGEVRRSVREKLANNKYYLAKVAKMYPNFNLYKPAADYLMQGGYTHLNYFYNGRILENVVSYDKASSYPHVMVTKKYPITEFLPYEAGYDKEKGYCYIMRVEFCGIQSKHSWNYIAKHKTIICYKGANDNGKIQRAARVEMWVTDIDYGIIVANYKIDSIKILECYRAFTGYLPIEFVKLVLNQYADKTTLRGIPERAALYGAQKSKLNSNFGLCCYNPINKEDYAFDSYEKIWLEPSKITDKIIQRRLDENKPILNFWWGVYITAWARRDLWEIISKVAERGLGLDCIYCDTDSVKLKNAEKHVDIIEAFNKSVDEEIKRVSEERGLDINLFIPADMHGKLHPIGHFEYEETYKRFKSFGAKKYCYEDIDGKFHAVVAGLKQEYIDVDGVHKTITSMTQFELPDKDTGKGGVIPNARSVFWHVKDQEPTTVFDRDGVPYTTSNKQGIVILNTNYTFSVEKSYNDLIKEAEGIILEGRNDYTNYFNFK